METSERHERLEIVKILAYQICKFARIFGMNMEISNRFPFHAAIILDRVTRNKLVFLSEKIEDNNDMAQVLTHEILHDALDHVPRMISFLGENATKEQETIWNLCADHIVNKIILEITNAEYIKKTGVFLDREFDPDIVNSACVEVLYRYIIENTKTEIKERNLDLNSGKRLESGKNSKSKSGKDGDDSNSGKNSGSNSDNDSDSDSDDNSVVIRECTIRNKTTGKVICKNYKYISAPRDTNGKLPSDMERTNGEFELAEGLKRCGTVSQTLNKEVDVIKNPLSLLTDLEHYMTTIRSGLDDISYLEPSMLDYIFGPESNIKYPADVINKCSCIIGIDVSGSISDYELGNFFGIIRHNIKYLDATIYQLDAELLNKISISDIQEGCESSILKGIETRYGCGGTDYSELFSVAKTANVDLLIIFTDLEPISWPEQPKAKVLWVVQKTIHTQNIKPPYGKVIWW